MAVSMISSTLLTIGLSVITATSSATPPVPPLHYPALQQEFIYVVKSDDTLSSIAQKLYGSDEYWTTLWNDNPDLSDKNSINEGMKLKIRSEKPLLIEKVNEHKTVQAEATPPVYSFSPSPESPIASSSSTEIVSPTPIVKEVTLAQSGPLTDEQLNFLGTCESGLTANRNSGNGFYGAFQFMISTWNHLDTGYERADLAPLDVQKAAVQKLLSRSSIFTQFPGCARKMVSAGLI